MTNDSVTFDSVQTEVLYLVKDSKFDVEKPYELAYDAKGVIPQSNMLDESRPVTIHNFRPFQNTEMFGDFGFAIMNIDDPLTAVEFHNENVVRDRYYPSIEKLLWQSFPGAAAVRIIEHDLRKRHPKFTGTEEISETVQPATRVHIDYSLYSADRTARAFFRDLPLDYRRLVTVNFWKSFQGPGNDWPLALCDYRTIRYGVESTPTDRVYHNRFTENQRLYFSPDHKWYYFKDLGIDEVLMFRQTDSDLEGGGGVAHASFHNPIAAIDAAPRESIELRAFVFFTENITA
ncbi:hypothetical protein B0O99DRAFT_647146 [Bisporella sp. PMI_857]|nr:hypothetical protein B0O99DRAFT_647146 [Bisporella sp. PMI_857]